MNTINNSILNAGNKSHINLTDQFHRIKIDGTNNHNKHYSLNMTKNESNETAIQARR
jgi:hypothetical protein